MSISLEKFLLNTRWTLFAQYVATSEPRWPSKIANYELPDPAKSPTAATASSITGTGPGVNE
jgi:hypothetical protein